ncbi:ComEC/Rec2 family competence protein [Erwinia sp. E_sp_W01_6]|uniref:ComEC/Rec2 family competence protein n=1 Tax=unclassified Erwinia TaxID=2622719 RepID=UPI0030D22CB5
MPYSLSRLAMWTIVAMLPLVFLPQLPEARYDGWIVLCALGLLRLCRCWAKDLAILMLLFLWAVMAGRTLLDQVDLLSQGTPDALIKIESVLNQSERLKIKLLKVNGKEIFPPVQALINVKQNKSHFCRAQKWSAKLKLRPVHARLNEGGFDAQRFALANSTPLTGRVLSLEPVEAGCGWRDRIIQRSEAAYGDLPWQSIISALAFGERGEVSQQMTRLLRETGTAHLMAISGMHISLAASVGWLIARALQLTFRAHWIGYRFPLFLSLMVALAYTWLSGGIRPPSGQCWPYPPGAPSGWQGFAAITGRFGEFASGSFSFSIP